MQWITILIALGAFSTQVYGAATGSLFEKLPITTPTWEEVEVTPGGDKVTFNGTVQEVHAQLLKLNPNYDNDFPVKRNEEPSSLTKRDFTYEKYYCWGEDGWHYADKSSKRGDNGDLKDGIKYLNSIGGTPGQSAGTCGRRSCSYNMAIYWCNAISYCSNSKKHYLKSYATIADGAQFLLDKCGGDNKPHGEVVAPNHWSVRVVSDAC
ncbi:uncharacterized protein TRUGW13939_03929 [Talaromyces rugulosus]|uniref:Ecp2 effector protein domain-containing protein n=1 Tax=Talaromyces rugulosus TaxID=121627 RepID=A0A7H8QSA2_TALRU|nr:uncharacterized protein TRUGW13939_03929 [Talaromyces rugulosus]QKX56822.1 hypothetical protein TRUGW13939_03929 [Talaromyces rugulosus]